MAKSMCRIINSRSGRLFWYFALLIALVFFFHRSYPKASQVDETAFACDSFGYLSMARVLRSSRGLTPDFAIESPQTRALIGFFKSEGLPLARWDEFIAPHAHHFQPISGHVMPQYPPGVGAALAAFPEGQAVRDLNIVTEWSLFLGGLALLGYCFLTNAWMASGFFTISSILGMEALRGIGTSSFSVNVSLIPILLGTFCLFLSLMRSQKARTKEVAGLALVSGLLFGFSIQARIASVLLIPGFLVLILRERRAAVTWVSGIVLGGIVPLLVHRYRVTGAWYLSTYNSADASAPSFGAVLSNLGYYLGAGPGARYDWAPWLLCFGFCAVTWMSHQRYRGPLSLARLWLGSALIWLVSVIYFLTHKITASYYIALSSFAYVLAVSFGILMIERNLRPRQIDARRAWTVSGLMVIAVIATALSAKPALLPQARGPAWPVEIPSELKSSDAWIWSDLTSGSFWYYGSKAAFKAPFAQADVRALALRWIRHRGEKLYLVLDSPDMVSVADDLQQHGARLTPHGQVFGQPYVEVLSAE